MYAKEKYQRTNVKLVSYSKAVMLKNLRSLSETSLQRESSGCYVNVNSARNMKEKI
jgi:hypothetical protein